MKYHSLALLFLLAPPTESFQPLLPNRHRRTTHLSYYKPNLPLSSRLSEIKSELTNIQKGGLDKFLLDEINTAQKRLSNDLGRAEKNADNIMKKGRGDEGKLMRDTLKNSDEMNVLLNSLKGVRQELEEVRGLKELGGVVEETLKNDLMLENDLQSVTTKVASSLKEAEMTIQSSIATLSTGELSDDDKENVLKQLESTIKSINQSLQTSNTLVSSAKKSADESVGILKRISEARSELMDAMEDTEDTIGFIAKNGGENFAAQEGKKVFEVVDGVSDAAYETVKEVEAVEKLANILTTKVGQDADAVVTLNAKTSELVLKDLQSVINAVKESKSSESTKLLAEYASKLKQQEESIKQFTNAIQFDIANDKSALDVVKSANIKLQALLDASETQVEMAKRAILTGESFDPGYVEQNIADVKSAVAAIADATKSSSEFAIGKLNSDMVAENSVKGKENIKATVVEKTADAPASKVDDSVKVESTAESTKTDRTEDKLEQKVETKTPDAKDDVIAEKSEQMKVETKAAEPKEDGVTAKSEQKVETNAEDAKEDVHIKPEPKIESKATDSREDEVTKPSVPEGTPTKDATLSSEAKEAQNEVKEPKQASSSNENSIHSEASKNDAENVTGDLDKKVVTSENAPDNSHSSITSDSHGTFDHAGPTTTPISLVEQAPSETHSASLTESHGTPIDIGDLHASASEVGHEFTNAVASASDVLHDLVDIVATSLLL